MIVVGSLTVLIVGSVLYLKKTSYQATPKAQKMSQQSEASNHYHQYTTNKSSDLGVIFYPGALVSPASYSLWANSVAQAGYDVYVVEMPVNLAVMAPNRADDILATHPEQKFVLAGHSLGGVMASRYASQHLDRLKGVMFMASYPDKKGSLRESQLPVLSLVGENDGVLDWDKYDSAKKYLPQDTIYYSISGGNHAGFGSYGKQKGDSAATVTNEEQQAMISQKLIEWLTNIN